MIYMIYCNRSVLYFSCHSSAILDAELAINGMCCYEIFICDRAKRWGA